jgi:hypothetical protein
MSQVVRLAETPQGRAALQTLVPTIGGVIASFIPPTAASPAKAAAIGISGILSALLSASNVPSGMGSQLNLNARNFTQSLAPQERTTFAQQLTDVATRYSVLSLNPPGGICLEEPKFRVSPDAEERIKRLRREARKNEEEKNPSTVPNN